MVFSSACNGVLETLRRLPETLGGAAVAEVLRRRVETSDPREIDGRFLELEFGRGKGGEGEVGASGAASPAPQQEERKFAKPRGPARRAR